VVGSSPRSGESEAPPRSGSSLSSEVEVESEPRVGRGGDRCLGPRLSPSPGSGEAEFVVFRGRARVRALGSGEAEFVVFRGRARVRALGRARRSFLWRPMPDLAAVSLTLSSSTAVGAMQAVLSSCQVGQWSGEVTAVTSALWTNERASG
jgi:hypothetical protein